MEPLRAKRPSNLPTSEMSPAQVQELKRAALGDDPLVELAIEAHTIGTIDVHEGNQVNLAARGTTPPPSQTQTPSTEHNDRATGVAAEPERDAVRSWTRGRAGAAAREDAEPDAAEPRAAGDDAAGRAGRVGAEHDEWARARNAPVPGTVQSLAPPPPRPIGAPQMFSGALPSVKKSRWPLGGRRARRDRRRGRRRRRGR